MAGPTRLELATSGVTGRRSNQLNYDPDKNKSKGKRKKTKSDHAFASIREIPTITDWKQNAKSRQPPAFFTFTFLLLPYIWWAVQDLNL
jgi:hypothetical protein